MAYPESPGQGPEVPPEVPVEEQFIVGFGETTFVNDAETARLNVDMALSTLLDALPATLLQKYVAVAANKAYFAIAVIRLTGPDPTLAHLQEEVDSGKEEKKPGYAYIEWVEHNAPIALAQQFNDPLLAQQWALTTLGATQPWTVLPPAGPPTIVAIVDSGLRLPGGALHADLDPARVVPVADCQPLLIPPFFADNVDREGHGTLLAGTIAALPNNAVGVASPIPVGWNIHLMPVKFFDPPNRPTAANACIAIAHAAVRFFNPFTGDNRVKVINASWHVPAGGGNLVALEVVTILAVRVLGCLVVFAAGNDGTDNQIYPLFPANLRNNFLLQGRVLTVLATDHYDAKASFSNYGMNTVDIGAPGIHILSTGRYLAAPPRFAQYNGTSPAAAYVSAGAALVFALNPGWQPADVVQHLTSSADVIQDLMIACIGGRRLNLSRAVYGPLQVVTPGAGAILVAGNPFNITWNVQYNNPLFNQVDIAFSNGGGPYVLLAAGVAIGVGAGAWLWPAPPVTVAPGGRIRITPTNGNFPAESGLFTAA
jgi:subtilisin family serine protease